MTVWTHDLLDALRQIGDPHLDDEKWRDTDSAPPEKESGDKKLTPDIRRLLAWRRSPTGARPAGHSDPYWKDEGTLIDARQLEIVHSLFAAYGGEIGASLLLASIPNAYAAAAGAAVLASTGELNSNPRRRIGETAHLVLDVLFPEGDRIHELTAKGAFEEVPALPIDGRGYARVRTTRLTHAVIRHILISEGWNPEATDPEKAYEVEASVARPTSTPSRWRDLWGLWGLWRTPHHAASEVGAYEVEAPEVEAPEDEAHPAVKLGLPINQEDLLGTLGTFTVTTFEVMEKLGVPWNDEAEHAYLMLWDRVGELLGIGTPEVWDQLPKEFKEENPDVRPLRPQSVAEAHALQDLIRQRVWPLPVRGKRPGAFDNKNGKVLVRALLDELQEAMPRGLLRLPLVVMRYLVHPTAHELLGLGGGGLPDSLMRWPSVERFTRGAGHRPGKDLIERSMRLAATDISRRAFIHFISTWEDTPADDRSRLGVSREDIVISKGRGAIGPA